MTKGELIEALEVFDDDTHVVVAVSHHWCSITAVERQMEPDNMRNRARRGLPLIVIEIEDP
jgi:hypothetical protein